MIVRHNPSPRTRPAGRNRSGRSPRSWVQGVPARFKGCGGQGGEGGNRNPPKLPLPAERVHRPQTMLPQRSPLFLRKHIFSIRNHGQIPIPAAVYIRPQLLQDLHNQRIGGVVVTVRNERNLR